MLFAGARLSLAVAGVGNRSPLSRIETVVSETKYYIRMIRGLLPGVLLCMAAALTLAQDAKDLSRIPARDSHDGITIAAEPWTDAALYKTRFPKRSPLDAGILAIDVYFRNDTDKPVRVNLERIRLLLFLPEGDRQKLEPLAAEDVADLIVNPGAKDPSPPRSRIPLPGRSNKKGKGKQWDETLAMVRAAGIGSDIVAPSGTLHGLVYFDLARQFDLVPYARLYVPDLVFLEKNKRLLYFELDLGASAPR